jgi:hypothetical protein
VPASSYVYLAFSALLLWFPRNWLRLGVRVTPKPPRKYNQVKEERDPHDRTVKPLTEAAKSRNWLDLFRAMIGGYGVFTVAEQQAEGGLSTSPALLVWAAAALLVGVLVQMIRIQGRLSLFAPIFFLQGLTFGVMGGVIGIISMLGSWALSPVLPSAGALLFVQGASTLCLSLLLSRADPIIGMVVAGISWIPVLIAVLLRKRLAAAFDKKLKIVPRDARTG